MENSIKEVIRLFRELRAEGKVSPEEYKAGVDRFESQVIDAKDEGDLMEILVGWMAQLNWYSDAFEAQRDRFSW